MLSQEGLHDVYSNPITFRPRETRLRGRASFPSTILISCHQHPTNSSFQSFSVQSTQPARHYSPNMKPFARAPPSRLGSGSNYGTPSSSSSSTQNSPSVGLHGRSSLSNLRAGSTSPTKGTQGGNMRGKNGGGSGSNRMGSGYDDQEEEVEDEGLPAVASGSTFRTTLNHGNGITPSASSSSLTTTPARRIARQSLPVVPSNSYTTPTTNRQSTLQLRARGSYTPLTNLSPSLLRNNSDPSLLFSPSSIIPFDTAGNKAAGEEAERLTEAKRRGRGEGLMGVDGLPMKPKGGGLFGGRKRLIRKRGLWDR